MQEKFFKFKVAIPARYSSTRLPGKPLLQIAGKPMVQHVYERACECGAEEVVIATDDKRIYAACNEFGAKVYMTSAAHTSGTDRLAELAELCGWKDNDIVVNLQGDEPDMPAELLVQVARNLHDNPLASIATLYVDIGNRDEISDPNVVKLVKDNNNFAIYFSRAAIPYDRDKKITDSKIKDNYFRHLGIYAYRVGFLLNYSSLEASYMEAVESLEQLRALSNGCKIHVDRAGCSPGIGVDTMEDLERVRVNYETI
ncbi:MAG: 3-deoxy-manno-octulosonate cytidylyltransferase [Gammaproteobacteria bacterium]|nr:MAG: 3-deoxy-manno-octulosonate cytidylyltransferase [Gammaproteobacteria bacterium]